MATTTKRSENYYRLMISEVNAQADRQIARIDQQTQLQLAIVGNIGNVLTAGIQGYYGRQMELDKLARQEAIADRQYRLEKAQQDFVQQQEELKVERIKRADSFLTTLMSAEDALAQNNYSAFNQVLGSLRTPEMQKLMTSEVYDRYRAVRDAGLKQFSIEVPGEGLVPRETLALWGKDPDNAKQAAGLKYLAKYDASGFEEAVQNILASPRSADPTWKESRMIRAKDAWVEASRVNNPGAFEAIDIASQTAAAAILQENPEATAEAIRAANDAKVTGVKELWSQTFPGFEFPQSKVGTVKERPLREVKSLLDAGTPNSTKDAARSMVDFLSASGPDGKSILADPVVSRNYKALMAKYAGSSVFVTLPGGGLDTVNFGDAVTYLSAARSTNPEFMAQSLRTKNGATITVGELSNQLLPGSGGSEKTGDRKGLVDKLVSWVTDKSGVAKTFYDRMFDKDAETGMGSIYKSPDNLWKAIRTGQLTTSRTLNDFENSKFASVPVPFATPPVSLATMNSKQARLAIGRVGTALTPGEKEDQLFGVTATSAALINEGYARLTDGSLNPADVNDAEKIQSIVDTIRELYKNHEEFRTDAGKNKVPSLKSLVPLGAVRLANQTRASATETISAVTAAVEGGVPPVLPPSGLGGSSGLYSPVAVPAVKSK